MYKRNESSELRWGCEEQGGNKIIYDTRASTEHSDICNKTGESEHWDTGYLGFSSGWALSNMDIMWVVHVIKTLLAATFKREGGEISLIIYFI